jgi:DNA-binding CsgD family transcriptional regulator/tetratricopeptide (TPR) repeat protein
VESLLEREAELELLAKFANRTVAGRGGLVLVGGEAGIGKTSLVRALPSRVDERVTFLTGACEPLSVPVPMGPLRELAEAAGGGDLIELGSDDRLVIARSLLGTLAERAPAVAAIEDLHWADPMTVDLVRLLARRVGDTPVAMIVTYRADEVAANPPVEVLLGDLATSHAVRRIVLRPLSHSAVRELAGPRGLDAGELTRVTGGNPFLVVETLAADTGLPASVRDAALARAGRLGAAARAVVETAAVIGQRFAPSLLDALTSDSAAAVDEALARGVLIADGPVLGFRHELIREAIESAVAPPRRAELHRRVVSALTQGDGGTDNARLAHHAELGGLTREGCRYATLAAADAERVGAPREVRLQAERALRLGTDLRPRERFELLIQYSRAANFSSARMEESATAAEDAVALAEQLDDAACQGRALIALAWALWSLDRVVDAKDAAERAISVLEPAGDAAALARAHATYIRMEATAFDPGVAIERGTRAAELAATAGIEEVQIDVAISIALARGHRGEHAAFAMLSDALRDARAAGLTIQVVRCYVNLMCIGALLRAHSLADQTADAALLVFDDYGTPIPARAIQSFLARSLLDRGRWDDALSVAAQSEATWHAEVPGARAIAALVHARRGEPGATELLEDAWHDIEPVAESSRHGLMRVALVEEAWLRGDQATARAHLRAAAASPATHRFARSGGELALWASRYGVDLAPPHGAPAPIALELSGDWRAAVSAWRELDAPYEAALAALPGDDRAARDALAALHKLGATAAAEAFVRHRTAAGARPMRGPRRSTLANAAGLTRREQDVLEQLAGGATNAAIAAALHLSERTVAHHVSAILGKLGAPNRVAAIDKARTLGLVAQDRPLSSQR